MHMHRTNRYLANYRSNKKQC